jgi:hypothetical protein
MTSTKQEMLHAYNTLLKQMEEKQAGELKPEKKIEKKKTKEAVQAAESLTTEEVAGEIGNLKIDIGKTLTRIDSLEKTAKDQGERITALTTQLEAAYQKVQDIALKTVEGASNSKSVASLQQLLGEQMRKQTAEK